MRRDLSLTQQNALRLVLVFVAFELVAAVAVLSLLMLPMARRAASDFGELLALSAETWSELPPQTRPAFERHLLEEHGILLDAATVPADLAPSHGGPYLAELEQALAQHFATRIDIGSTHRDGEDWHWVALPSGGRQLWLGFPHSRVGAQPAATIAFTFIAGLLMAVGAAWWLARRTAEPLQRLEAAAATLGRGERPERLPESGPRELAALARRINTLTQEVQDLLDGRTTLLAGLSHDLRTPLARMRLALEMLQRRPDERWIARLDADVEEMNRLVGDMLELARGLGREAPVPIDVRVLLEELAQEARDAGAAVDVEADAARIDAPRTALRRLLGNLLSNAQRYGEGRPIRIEAGLSQGHLRIGVLDRGPGIPPDQMDAVFRPFHRVETSRSATTGGSGLGLAIVRQLADANGWRVTLENRDGGGLAAWLDIPPDPPRA